MVMLNNETTMFGPKHAESTARAGMPEKRDVNGDAEPVFRAAAYVDELVVRRREKIVPNQT